MASDIEHTDMSYYNDLKKRIDHSDYPGFLKIWEEYCYSDEFDPKELILILETTKNSPLSVKFGNHVERGMTLWNKIEDPEASHEVLKLIFDIQTTNSESLFDIALKFLKEKYPNDPKFQDKLKLIDLKGGESFQGAISRYELLTHMKKGNFVFHNGGWGTAEILDVSLIREEVSLECEYVVGIKHLSFSNAFKTLIPLPPQHFLSRRFGNPDLFEKEARENPLEVIRALLKDLGPKTASDIKEELCDLVIPNHDWNRWWQTARNKIKKDTKIASPKSLKKPFRLRDEEVPHEVVFYKSLEAKPTIDETIQMIYSFMRDFPETLKNKEFKTSLDEKIEDILKSDELNDYYRLQLLFFQEDLGSKKDKKLSSTFIKSLENPSILIENIEILAFKKRILTLIHKHREDWKKIFFSCFFSIEQGIIRDYVLNQIVKSDSLKELKTKLEDLLQHPLSYPEVFTWYFQKILDKKSSLPFSDDVGKCRFFEGFLILLDHLSQKSKYRDLSKKMLNFITQKRYQLVRDIFEIASLENVQEFLLLASKCEILSDHDRKIIQSLAEVVYPALSNLRKDDDESDTIIWSTKEGYQKTKEKIEHIASVETVENAKEIEEARSHGDLRENAEFKSALEKRDRLQAELKFLSDQLNHARIITHSDISVDRVGVGSIVECTDDQGKTKTFTILGPWDANPDLNIISFQSKIAKSMNEKKVGDTFTFQNENYTISDIRNFFNEK